MILNAFLMLALALANAFTIATAPYTYHFPRDHFAHDTYRSEWWYFTGHLRAADGHRFGFELTFFRFGLVPHARASRPGQSRWRAAQMYPAHFAITDETTNTFVSHEALAREALDQGDASEQRFAVHVYDWSLRGEGEGRDLRMLLHARSGADAIDLMQQPQKPLAIQGQNGISRKGPCSSCASHYYSFTRLQTRGTLVRSGRRYEVTGVSWMDHEYGSGELLPNQAGWDWFSIQLDDDREIMLYRLRQRDGGVTPQSSGSLIARNGSVRYLPLRAFQIQSTAWWTSPHTSARYPARWIVRVAGIQAPLLLTPTVADQELIDPRGTSTYWEGAVDVRDARTNNHLGVGYVELTGYAMPLRV
jgi:predicted secreted hydrolase